ncbi:PucR family transcriptional regulator [Streptomyces aidingensis]|uniref:PucR C-terminal helix-turn-helix domain-containing protein n=1 Tax=Streptomyces aidingensis TaxID=910347 RepID=A0A1I1IRT0_9ACTN|nr:PucR family transcriptional regulator ligand-binding domain-containing protein [Streptomyces aidingensis]SFC38944.1 PucR C-terminal helix-turn-helix domain-containing protein [Streptomyces aidingensis]
MRLHDLLAADGLGLRLLHGDREALDRPVRGVMTTDLRDPSRYLSGGELVLTGLAWRRSPADSEPFVRVLARAGVAGLAAGEAELGAVPPDLAAACARSGLPLFAVDEAVSFAAITEYVVRRVSRERSGDLAAIVERHRRLVAAGPAGGGPRAVLELLGTDLDLRAWLLAPSGRVVAASGPEPLPRGAAAELLARHLATARSGRPGPHRVRVPADGPDGTVYALLPVRGETGDVRQRPALSDWLLAVASDPAGWPAQRLTLLTGVAGLIAAERLRAEADRTVGRRLAQEVLELVAAGAAAAEVAARLRVLAPSRPSAWQVVCARLEWPDAPSGTAAGARSLLEELLPEGAAVGHGAGEAVALVPLAGGAPPVRAGALLEPVRAALEAGLAPDGRLTVGVSAAVGPAEGLRGALEEARHARRLAAARGERVAGAGDEELASHVLLLPFVPEEVRRVFTARLLDPLRDYDRRHRAELMPTLEAFLACDGSWTRCAGRLHVHVNTLRYRIGRIEELTARDLTRLEDRVDFFLALRLT